MRSCRSSEVLETQFPQHQVVCRAAAEAVCGLHRTQSRVERLRLRRLAAEVVRLVGPRRKPARRSAGRFDCVLVDEYQDTNRLQSRLLQGLCPDGRGLTVVGDDAQSIYSFRAATVRNIMDFPKQFPGTQIVTLEQNYRSTQPILEATNRVMAEAERAVHEGAVVVAAPAAAAAVDHLRGRARAGRVRGRADSGAPQAQASRCRNRRSCSARRITASNWRASWRSSVCSSSSTAD